MDLALNNLIRKVMDNDPARHRYIMKEPFSKVAGALPYDQGKQKYISYEKLRRVNLNAKHTPPKGAGE